MTNTQAISTIRPIHFKEKPDLLGAQIAYIRKLVEAGGPQPEEAAVHYYWYEQLFLHYQLGFWTAMDLQLMRLAFGEVFFSTSTLLGKAFLKLGGRAGDAFITDSLETNDISTDQRFFRRDLFFQAQTISDAYKNRKRFFQKWILQKLVPTGKKHKVLILGSGRCREIREILELDAVHQIQFHCILQDEKTLAFARRLLKGREKQVLLTTGNLFRLPMSKEYDLIWCPDLFNYLGRKGCLELLSKYSHCVKSGGSMLIGNFHPANTSRAMMETLIDWYVQYRQEDELFEIAEQSGWDPQEIADIQPTEDGVNLFLQLQRKS